jgi:L-iditol 2-dehydrogenase
MRAVVKYGLNPGETRLMDMPEPKTGPADVLVKVAAIGVCGTDPHMHRGTSAFNIQPPLIFGHEFAGTIVELGRDVTGWQVGDRVTAETHADYCGVCSLCRTNQYHLCRDRKGFGFKAHGAFAEWVAVPQRILHRVPDSIPLTVASITEPLCVAHNALNKSSRVIPGDRVAIIGPGPIGLLCAMIARLNGASEIAVIGTAGDDMRLEIAKAYGATVTMNTSREEARVLVKAGDGYGYPLVVDTAGVSATLDLSLDLVRPGGQITKIGWGPQPVGFSIDRLLHKNATLKGHFSHTWDTWEAVLQLMATGQADLGQIITHQLPLEQWEHAFELVENKEALKVVLVP